MGAPAITYFCEKGHIAIDVPHHYLIDDEKLECPYCHSKEIKSVVEWHDPDYGDINKTVSHKPERFEKVSVKIPVYDVSKLFGKI